MKSHRKLIVAFAILIALGIVGTAIAVTYYPHTPITDVSITGTLSDEDSVAISSDHTMTCTTSTDTDKYCDETGWHYPPDPVTHTWSGPGTFNPTTGTSVTWTAPNSTGDKTITVTADDSPLYDETAKTDSITVTVVKVDKLQYYKYESQEWLDVGGIIYVPKDDFVKFRAVPDPNGVSWPSGKPVWGGSSGASGTGEEKIVIFSTVSSSSSDYKTVWAECGNTVTVNVICFDFEGTLTPADPFTGRILTKYGLEEIVYLDCDITPSGLTGTQVGGLRWDRLTGVGTLSSVTSNGTATYDAGASAGFVTLVLELMSGPCEGHVEIYEREVIPPSGTRITKATETVGHIRGWASAQLALYHWLDPKNVSFSNLKFGEDTCPSTNISGFYLKCEPWNSYPDGTPIRPHSQNGPFGITGGNITTGCRVSPLDFADTGAAHNTKYAAGSYTWSIPPQYIDDTATRHSFGSNQNHVSTYNANGKAIQFKGGQTGWANLWSKTTGWY